MAAVEFARAVIMEIMPGEFDALGMNPGMFNSLSIGLLFHEYNPLPATLDSFEPGDFVYFRNNLLYGKEGGPPDKGWTGEATIVITSGANGTYYGWNSKGGMTLTYEQWRQYLCDRYNDTLPDDKEITIDDIPEYPIGSDAGFIDVAQLAMSIFDYRKMH